MIHNPEHRIAKMLRELTSNELFIRPLTVRYSRSTIHHIVEGNGRRKSRKVRRDIAKSVRRHGTSEWSDSGHWYCWKHYGSTPERAVKAALMASRRRLKARRKARKE